MHSPFDDVRHSPDASSNVNYFYFLEANVKRGLYEINKKNLEQMLHMDQVRSKNVPGLNRSDVGPERSRTCTNTGW